MKFKSKTKSKTKAKPRSKNQQWASERNWNKSSLLGIKAQITRIRNSNSTCPVERDILLYAFVHLRTVLDLWDENKDTSKEQYLKG